MAVDFFHRIVVVGPRESVASLRTRIARKTELSSFSFESLYEIAPSARAVEAEPPWDPYDLSVWPTRRLNDGRSELRYQFHTRNLEVADLIRELSRNIPRVTFVLVTFCLDDGSIASYRVRAGRRSAWFLGQKLQTARWQEARRKFRLGDDELFDDEDARSFAEELMLADALAHWLPGEADRSRKRRWHDRPVERDLETEREIVLLALSQKIEDERKRQRQRSRTVKLSKRR